MKVEVLWVVVKHSFLRLLEKETLVTGVGFPLGAALGPKTKAYLASLGLFELQDACTDGFLSITL